MEGAEWHKVTREYGYAARYKPCEIGRQLRLFQGTHKLALW
jgi:hypothetical protein